jgi:hypothetical protein
MFCTVKTDNDPGSLGTLSVGNCAKAAINVVENNIVRKAFTPVLDYKYYFPDWEYLHINAVVNDLLQYRSFSIQEDLKE